MNGVQCPGRIGAACRSVHRRLCPDPGRVVASPYLSLSGPKIMDPKNSPIM